MDNTFQGRYSRATKEKLIVFETSGLNDNNNNIIVVVLFWRF